MHVDSRLHRELGMHAISMGRILAHNIGRDQTPSIIYLDLIDITNVSRSPYLDLHLSVLVTKFTKTGPNFLLF